MRRLSQRRIDNLKPKKTTYEVRDGELKGFGVRVLPSGTRRYFVHHQHEGRRAWKTIGDTDNMTEAEARRHAVSIIAALGNGEKGSKPGDVLFEDFAEEVFRRYGRNWKPRTLAVSRSYLRNQILPYFGGRRISEITREDVQSWFSSLHATPVAADRSAPVLSVILRQAETYGHRPEGSNPCVNIRRYRRRGRERFLSREELVRLAAVLAEHEADAPDKAAIIRLLILTGCRKGEVLDLEWRDYREGKLYLRDSKTGPRTVWLSAPARRLLDGLPQRDACIFPGRRRGTPMPASTLDEFWKRVRRKAGIGDARLHDLRHSWASIALSHGEPVPVIGRLLGHNDPSTTLKYTHFSERQVHEAAETIAPILGGRA